MLHEFLAGLEGQADDFVENFGPQLGPLMFGADGDTCAVTDADAALVSPPTDCLAVNVWLPTFRFRTADQVPSPATIGLVPEGFPPSKADTTAPDWPVPLTVTVLPEMAVVVMIGDVGVTCTVTVCDVGLV